MLRRLTPERLALWLATSAPSRVRLEIECGEGSTRIFMPEPGTRECRCLVAGARLQYLLIDLPLPEALPTDRWIGYSIALQPLGQTDAPWQTWSDWAPDLVYPGRTSPGFKLPARVGALLHGSCRKPHYAGGDGLVQADRLLARCLGSAEEGHQHDAANELPSWPSMLVLSGDQIYAENWMAHRGAAYAILNIFRHPKTPHHFVVLSGDVHYSFVYDVELRGRTRGPDIWQICSSGVRNEFPPRLLDVLDRANRWLYSPRSPLNWFTRRRRMRVIPRKPEGTPPGRRLLNGSGIGLVELDETGAPWRIRELLADGRTVAFTRREDESRWD